MAGDLNLFGPNLVNRGRPTTRGRTLCRGRALQGALAAPRRAGLWRQPAAFAVRALPRGAAAARHLLDPVGALVRPRGEHAASVPPRHRRARVAGVREPHRPRAGPVRLPVGDGARPGRGARPRPRPGRAERRRRAGDRGRARAVRRPARTRRRGRCAWRATGTPTCGCGSTLRRPATSCSTTSTTRDGRRRSTGATPRSSPPTSPSGRSPCPRGGAAVTFEYASAAVRWGVILSVAAWLAIAVALVLGLRRRSRTAELRLQRLRRDVGAGRPLLQQRYALGEHLRLVGQPRHRDARSAAAARGSRRRRGRTARSARRRCRAASATVSSRSAPGGEDEQERRARPATAGRSARAAARRRTSSSTTSSSAGGADDRDDLDARRPLRCPGSAATGARPPGSGTGRRRASPTNSASSTLIM